VRRRLRRGRVRRKTLIKLLQEKGFVPSGQNELERFLLDANIAKELKSNYPYRLRAEAFERELSLEEISRILLHINKRRGFKSNRKQQAQDKEAGKVKKAIANLKSQRGQHTIGQYFAEKLFDNPFDPIRNRYGNYNLIAERKDLEEEVDLIFEYQRKYHKELTDSFLNNVKVILFSQLPFELTANKKRKVIGSCSLFKGQQRLGMDSRKAQQFRFLQKINDLRVSIGGDEFRHLTVGEHEKLYAELNSSKERTFTQIRKFLKWLEGCDVNLEYKANDKILGNAIDSQLKSPNLFGKSWGNLSEGDKTCVWEAIQRYLKDENEKISLDNLLKGLKSDYDLTAKNPEKIDTINEPTGTLNYCEKAVDKILPFMEAGDDLYSAIKKAGFTSTWSQRKMLALPNKQNGFDCRNPIVSSVLYQLRKIVNQLIKEIGKPERIIVELSRELKGSKDLRKEIVTRQTSNQKERQKADKAIRDLMGWGEDASVSGGDILKWRLWQDQKEFCVYSGRKIAAAELFGRGTEVDHILPYSMSLDNSMNNKVLCFAGTNQQKGQNTPIDWLGDSSPGWEELQVRVEKLNLDERKVERFGVHNDEIGDKYTPARLLNETSYIGRMVCSYLKTLYDSEEAEQGVKTSKGMITWQLRNIWNLNPILRDGEMGEKNRDDLRHHALDAAVVAATSVSMIQGITKKLQKHPGKRARQVADIVEPWDGFGVDLAEAIGKINVSHRVLRKVSGGLHKETNYHLETNGKYAGKYITRKNLGDLTSKMVTKICDDRVRVDRLSEKFVSGRPQIP